MTHLTQSDSIFPSSKAVWKAVVFVVVLSSLLAVMIWDMKKAQHLSEIIHNDHASRWAQMDTKMLAQWLSPLDLCMLRVDQPSVDLKAYRAKNCSKLSSIGGVQSQKLFCNIGSSLGRQCAAPLSTRSFFTARIKDDFLGDPNAKFLSNSLKLIASSHRPIVFVGDGLSKQNQDAMICEIMRTDRVTITGSMSNEYSQLQSNFTVRWRDTSNSLKLDVMYLKMTHILETKLDVDIAAGRGRKRRKVIRSLTNLTENSNSTRDNNSSIVNKSTSTTNNNATVTDIPRAAASLSFDEVRRTVDALVEHHRGVILVANLGVWYNSREKFRAEMPLFLQWINTLGAQIDRDNLVFFRETAAQHWNQSSTGYYSYEERESNNGSCAPVKDATPEFDWRNNDVHHIVANEELRQIHSIPFRDLTLPLFNMHPSDNEGVTAQDCTHYCYFPQMWQSVWHDIYTVAINATQHSNRRNRRNTKRLRF